MIEERGIDPAPNCVGRLALVFVVDFSLDRGLRAPFPFLEWDVRDECVVSDACIDKLSALRQADRSVLVLINLLVQLRIPCPLIDLFLDIGTREKLGKLRHQRWILPEDLQGFRPEFL